MRSPVESHRKTVGANLTAMIDVVFLLIIFFLVSSHLARQENRLPLETPFSIAGTPVAPNASPLTISIDRTGQVYLRGSIVSKSELLTLLKSEAAAGKGPVSLRVRVSGDASYRDVEPVLRDAAIAGITGASLSVREPSL